MSLEVLQSQIDCLRDRMEDMISESDILTTNKIINISQKLDLVLNLYYEATLKTDEENLSQI